MIPEYHDKLVIFIRNHIRLYDEDLLKEYIRQHESFGTMDYAVDTNDNIVGFIRFNLSDDGKCVHVLDFCVKEQHRWRGIGRDFIKRALVKFPNIEKIRFQRGLRGQEEYKELNIKGILKRKIL